MPVSCLIVISEGQELLCGSRGCANVPEAVTLAQSQHLGYLAVRTGLRQRFLRPMTTGRTLLVARGTTSTRPMFAFGDGHALAILCFGGIIDTVDSRGRGQLGFDSLSETNNICVSIYTFILPPDRENKARLAICLVLMAKPSNGRQHVLTR